MDQPKKVLVTGATGKIGYMVFRRLLEQSTRYDAYALDCKREPSVSVPSTWSLEIPDDRPHLCTLTDFAGIQSGVQGMDVVVYLATDPEGESWKSLLNNNLIGAYHIFEACKEACVLRIVAASSIIVSQGHHELRRNTAVGRNCPRAICTTYRHSSFSIRG